MLFPYIFTHLAPHSITQCWSICDLHSLSKITVIASDTHAVGKWCVNTEYMASEVACNACAIANARQKKFTKYPGNKIMQVMEPSLLLASLFLWKS